MTQADEHFRSTSYKISRRFERSRNLGQRRLLSFAYWHAADAEESTFLCCFGKMLANLLQPALVGRRIARCLGIDNCRSFPKHLYALVLDLSRLAAFELGLQRVSRRTSLGRIEIVNNRLDKRIGFGISFDFCQFCSASKALLQKAPQSVRLCSRNSDAGRNRAL